MKKPEYHFCLLYGDRQPDREVVIYSTTDIILFTNILIFAELSVPFEW